MMSPLARMIWLLWVLVLMVGGCSDREIPNPRQEETTRTAAAINSSPSLSDFVLLGERRVVLNDWAATSGGDVGVVQPGGEPVSVWIQHRAEVGSADNVLGDTVFLGLFSSVGDVQANQWFAAPGATHGQIGTLPQMPTMPDQAAVAPGASDVIVAAKSVRLLAPGSYDRVVVHHKAVLKLEGGTYHFRTVELDTKARMEALAPADVRVQERLEADGWGFVGAVGGLTAKDLRVEVHGSDDGHCLEHDAVDLGEASEVRALLFAPSGTVHVKHHAQVRGAFVGRFVDIGPFAQVTFEDGFVPASGCVPPSCDDGNSCTVDACVAATCQHTPVAVGTSCSDGNACNGDETCSASGSCVAGGAPVIDDGNICTTDSCDPSTGVHHTPVAVGTSCADGNACNGDETCNASGSCAAGTAPTIDDGNTCTTDSCDPATGVHHNPVAVGTPCADANACNGEETCNASGSCVAGTAPTIDDGNTCTTDSCDPVTGVHHTPVAVGTPCSDSNACNGASRPA